MKKITKRLMSVLLVFTILAISLLPEAGIMAANDIESATITYVVSVKPVKHGKVTTDKQEYYPGEKVVVSVEPDQGYRLQKLWAENLDGAGIKVQAQDGAFQFSMPEGNVKIAAVIEEEHKETGRLGQGKKVTGESAKVTGKSKEIQQSERLRSETTKDLEELRKSEKEQKKGNGTQKKQKPPKNEASENKKKIEEEVGTPKWKVPLQAVQDRIARSAADDVDYVSIKNKAKGLFQGATKISDGMVIPNDYTGFMRRTTGLVPTLHFAYDSTYETADKSYPSIILKSAYKDGRISVTYPRSCFYNGTWVDIKVTATDWKKDGDKNINMFFTGERPGVMVQNCSWIELKYDFYVAGTTTPIVVKGYSTWKDIDFDQGIVLKDGFVRTKASIYAVDGAQSNLAYQTVNGNPYFFDDHNSNATDQMPGHMITALYEGSTLKAVYTFVRHTVSTVGGGAITNESDKYLPGPVSIQKRVSDNDEKMVAEDTLNQSPEPRKEGFTYTITATTAGETEDTYYMAYSIRDPFVEALNVNTAGITIIDEKGSNVKGWFDIGISGSNVLTISAKSTSLQNAGFYGKVFTINVPVTIKDFIDLRSSQYWDVSKNMAAFRNQAYLDSDACQGEISSNQVTTWVPLEIPDGYLIVNKVEDGTDIPLSGVTFQVYEWNGNTYNTTPYDILDDGKITGTYQSTKPYIITTTNQGKFKVVETQSSPDHFNPGWSQEIQYDGTAAKTLTYSVTNVKMEPKIAVTKLADRTTMDEDVKIPGWYKYGDKIIYAIVVKNTGNVPVKNLTVTDTMSEDLLKAVDQTNATFDIPEMVTTVKGKSVTVTKSSATQVILSGLEPDDSVLLTFSVNVGERDQVKGLQNLINLDNVVKVTGIYHNGHQDTKVPEDADDTDNDKINVFNPLISITKLADRTIVQSGGLKEAGWYDFQETVTYSMEVKNYGNVSVHDLMVTDTLSEILAAAVYVDKAGFTDKQPTETHSGEKIQIKKKADDNKTLTLDCLGAGDSVVLTFEAKIRPRAELKDWPLDKLQNLKNQVKVTGMFNTQNGSEQVSPDADDEDSDHINIYNPLISVTKLADRTTRNEAGTKENGWYHFDETVVYHMKIKNYGNVAVDHLVVTDEMSQELAAVVHSDQAGFILENTEPDLESTQESESNSENETGTDLKHESELERGNQTENREEEESEAQEEQESEDQEMPGTPTDSEDPISATVETTEGKAIQITLDSINHKQVILDRLEPGDSVELTFTARVRSRDELKTFGGKELEQLGNYVRITGQYDNHNPEPAPVPEDEDDQDQDKVNIYNPLISVTKLSDRTQMNGEGVKIPGEYDFEETITYFIQIKNYGNVNVENLEVEDFLSEKLQKAVEVSSASFIEGVLETEQKKEIIAYKESNTKLRLDQLMAGDSVTVTFQVRIKGREELKDYNAAELEKLSNQVTVTGEYDNGKDVPKDEDDDDGETINVRNPKLSVIKVADQTSGITIKDGSYVGEKEPGMYDFGDKVTYNIFVKNTGTEELFHIHVTDSMSKRLLKIIESGSFQVEDSVKTSMDNLVGVQGDEKEEAIIEKLLPGESVMLKFVVVLRKNNIQHLEDLKNTVTVTASYDPDDPKDVPIDEDDEDQDTFHLSYGFVEIKKTSKKDGKVLKGAEFEIHRKDGTLVETIITDSKGTAKSRELGMGEYYLLETKAPEGYERKEDRIIFEIKKYGQTVKKIITNKPEKRTVQSKEEDRTQPPSNPPVKTGDHTKTGIYVVLLALSFAFLQKVRKRGISRRKE